MYRYRIFDKKKGTLSNLTILTVTGALLAGHTVTGALLAGHTVSILLFSSITPSVNHSSWIVWLIGLYRVVDDRCSVWSQENYSEWKPNCYGNLGE